MKKILLLCFAFCQFGVYSCNASEPIVLQSTQQVNDFVKNFTDKIKEVLFSQKDDKEKIALLEQVFDTFSDCTYIKKMTTKDFITKHKIDENMKAQLNEAAFRYLLSRYVKITSDYNEAMVSNIVSKKNGSGYTSTFDIVVNKRGQKVFKCKLFTDDKKVKAILINNINLGDSKGICSKIERDFASDANKFIQYINNNF